MNLDVLLKILADAGVGIIGQQAGSTALPMFKNRIPATVTRALVLKTSIEGEFVDNYLPGFFGKSRFQVIVRSGVQADGDAICKQVVIALKNERKVIYNDAQNNFLMQINYILLDRKPVVYTR